MLCGQAILDVTSGSSILSGTDDALILVLQGTPTAPFRVTVPDATALYVTNNQTTEHGAIGTEHGNPAEILPRRNGFVFVDSALNANSI